MSRCWHRPSVLAVILLVAGAGLFVRLGIWQLSRADEKQALLDSHAAARAEPVPLTATARDPGSAMPHVRVRGRFVPEHGYWLDEQPSHGRIGVHAIGVFVPQDETRRLLVDRGWVEWSHAPGTVPAAPPLPEGEVELVGLYAPPPAGGLRLGGNALPAQATWPKLTLFLELDAIAQDLGVALFPRVLLLDAQPGSGFVREWQPQTMPPSRHRGYAFQWFALAAASVVVFVALHWRKPRGDAAS